MKKIINNSALVCLYLGFSILQSCSSSKKESQDDKRAQTILNEVTETRAIGKVTSVQGDVLISSPSAGIIKEIFVQEGDSVHAGQTLITLKYDNTDLELEQTRAQLQQLQSNEKVTLENIKNAEIKLRELEGKYQTSKRLFSQNAETRENLEGDLSNWQQQRSNLQGLYQQLEVHRAQEKEQRIKIEKADRRLHDLQIKAAVSGTISDFPARIGQSISSTEKLGTIIQIENPIIQAEVDELFANDIRVGQHVEIFPVGRLDKVSSGKIFYISPILSNKSILYETANEAVDRRVRQVKIEITGPNNLVINSKVDCIIKIK
ncbi:HlyD family secretion protein [Sphingobacterium sp. xlx-130]|uniref:HlyD family secretion protein n=1 Tax=Sphingobacterium sp. xlx-130 TaxID=2654323 RepID=UPI0013D93117|nr:efflux RND transporter periplasmic adaptor subunit [Sphingobacterium sp. xlx-130]